METYAKECPTCQTPTALQAPTCHRCGHRYRTQFAADTPPVPAPEPVLTGKFIPLPRQRRRGASPARLLLGISFLGVLATTVWPTRYRYEKVKAGAFTTLARIDGLISDVQ